MFSLILMCILLGTVYCGWLCPLGFIQELFDKIPIMKIHVHKKLDLLFRIPKYIIFILYRMIQITFVIEFMFYDSYSYTKYILDTFVINYIALAFLLLVLLTNLFIKRFYCRYLCYSSARVGVGSLLFPFRITRNNDTCINCDICNNVCPVDIEVSKKHQVHDLNCNSCYKCMSKCPVEKCLKLSVIKITKK